MLSPRLTRFLLSSTTFSSESTRPTTRRAHRRRARGSGRGGGVQPRSQSSSSCPPARAPSPPRSKRPFVLHPSEVILAFFPRALQIGLVWMGAERYARSVMRVARFEVERGSFDYWSALGRELGSYVACFAKPLPD
jgi:hypothetical protein